MSDQKRLQSLYLFINKLNKPKPLPKLRYTPKSRNRANFKHIQSKNDDLFQIYQDVMMGNHDFHNLYNDHRLQLNTVKNTRNMPIMSNNSLSEKFKNTVLRCNKEPNQSLFKNLDSKFNKSSKLNR